MPKPDMPYGMTSREAAALYLSEGYTTDADLANKIDAAKHEPTLLIPRGSMIQKDYKPAPIEAETLVTEEDKERIRLHEYFGFDIDVTVDPERLQATFKDKALKLKTRCMLTGDADVDGAKMSKAMLRLKAKHDKVVSNE